MKNQTTSHILVPKWTLENMKKEVSNLHAEVKQNTYYKHKFKCLQKEHQEIMRKYIESQSLRKQQESMIELQHQKID